MNPLDKLLNMYYNKKKCAEALGINESRLSNWISKKFIPYNNGEMIEEKTGGKIKAADIYKYAAKHKKQNEKAGE